MQKKGQKSQHKSYPDKSHQRKETKWFTYHRRFIVTSNHMVVSQKYTKFQKQYAANY